MTKRKPLLFFKESYQATSDKHFAFFLINHKIDRSTNSTLFRYSNPGVLGYKIEKHSVGNRQTWTGAFNIPFICPFLILRQPFFLSLSMIWRQFLIPCFSQHTLAPSQESHPRWSFHLLLLFPSLLHRAAAIFFEDDLGHLGTLNMVPCPRRCWTLLLTLRTVGSGLVRRGKAVHEIATEIKKGNNRQIYK